MAEESEDDEMFQLRNTLLASMRSSKAESSQREGSPSSSKSQIPSQKDAEIFDTDINDLEALREAALRSVKPDISGAKATVEPASGNWRIERSASSSVRLRPTHACLQFPSIAPRFNYYSRLNKNPRSNLIVIQPVPRGEDAAREKTQGILDTKRQFADKTLLDEGRKRTDKWSRGRSSRSSSDKDSSEEEESGEEDKDSDSEEEEAQRSEGAEDASHKEEESGGVSPASMEEKETVGESAEMSAEKDQPCPSSSPASTEDNRAENVVEAKSLKIFVPEGRTGKARNSQSMDEEMLELEEGIGENIIEFLEEDPEGFSTIFPESVQEKPETIRNDSSISENGNTEFVNEKGKGKEKNVTRKARAKLKSQLADVDRRLHELSREPKDERRHRHSSRSRDRKERERRDRDRRDRDRKDHSDRHYSHRSARPPQWKVSSSVVSLRTSDRQSERGTKIRKRRPSPERERNRTSKPVPKKTKVTAKTSTVTAAGLGRSFTATPHPLMDVRVEKPPNVPHCEKEKGTPSVGRINFPDTQKCPVESVKLPRNEKPVDLREVLTQRKLAGGDSETADGSQLDLSAHPFHSPPQLSLQRTVSPIEENRQVIIPSPSYDAAESAPSQRTIIRLRPSSSQGMNLDSGNSLSPGGRSRSPIRAPIVQEPSAMMPFGTNPVNRKAVKKKRGGVRKTRKEVIKEVPHLIVNTDLQRRVIVSDNGSGNSFQASNTSGYGDISCIRNTGRIKLKK